MRLLAIARRRRWVFIPPLTYLLAYSAVTWPWPLQMWTSAPAAPDHGMFVWGFWWMRHALETLTWPLSTEHVLAPTGVTLAFQTMHLQAMVSVPLQFVLSVPVAYNVVAVAVVVLAGVFTYLLARDIGLRRPAALVAGFLFAASPHLAFRYGTGGHMNLAQAMWIPLLLLLLRGYLRRPTPVRAALGGAAVAGALYSDFTIALFAVFLSAAYLLTVVLAQRRPVTAALHLVNIAAAMTVFGVLAAPLGLELAGALRAGVVTSFSGLGGSDIYLNEVTALLLPNRRPEGYGHLGLAATVLGAVGLAMERRQRALVVWLAGAVAVSAVLSLGPHIVVGEARLIPFAIELDEGSTPASALMPFTWVQAVFSHLRIPMRFLLLGALPLALLAGFGIEHLNQNSRQLSIALLAVLIPIAVSEARSPIHTRIPDLLPPAYAPIAADDRGDVIVLDIPFGVRTGFHEFGAQKGPPLIFATKHGKPVAHGFAARLSKDQLSRAIENALYTDVIALQDVADGEPLPDVDPDAARAWAASAGVGYVVLRHDTAGYEHLVEYLYDACFTEIARDEERLTMRFDCQ